MNRVLEAQAWIKKRCTMGRDTSKPIRFKTIQQNTKLAEFDEEKIEKMKEDTD